MINLCFDWQVKQRYNLYHYEFYDCGCPKNPLGGLARKTFFLKNMMPGRDSILIDAGNALFDSNQINPDNLSKIRKVISRESFHPQCTYYDKKLNRVVDYHINNVNHRCRKKHPKLNEIKKNHFVACHS